MGQNETLIFPELYNPDNYPDNKLIIFNRWGDIVFEKENYRNSWDGTLRNTKKPLPTGTYYFVLWLDIDAGEIKDGQVVIIR